MAFQVNFIKDRVLSVKERKNAFAAFLLYLLLCAALAVTLTYRTASGWIRLSKVRQEVRHSENTLRRLYPQAEDILTYAKKLKIALSIYNDKLTIINQVLSNSFDVSDLLLRLNKALPEQSHIVNFKLDREKQSLSFDLIVPRENNKENQDMQELVSACNQQVAEQFGKKDIKASMGQVQGKDDSSTVILQFSYNLKDKEV